MSKVTLSTASSNESSFVPFAQLEEDKDDLQRQLNHDRHARILAEQMNEEHAKLQQSLTYDAQHTSTQKVCKTLSMGYMTSNRKYVAIMLSYMTSTEKVCTHYAQHTPTMLSYITSILKVCTYHAQYVLVI